MSDETVTLYCVERRHLDDLRAVSSRLASGAFMDAVSRKEAAMAIMSAVRFAEVLDALRGPGELEVHVCPKGEP